MERKLHFNIIIKYRSEAADRIDVNKLKSLWPGYQYGIHVDDKGTGFIYDVMIHAYVLEDGQQKAAASRGITVYDEMVAGSLTDTIDFIMEELLKRINKTQNTDFSREKSSFWSSSIHDDVFDSLTYAFGRSPSHIKPWYKQYIDIPELKRVHSSGPVSVAIWSNGKKSMVRRQKGDKSDPEKGILYAVIKGLCYEKGGTKEYSRVLDMIHEALEERKNG